MDEVLAQVKEATAGRAVPLGLPSWCQPIVLGTEDFIEVQRRGASSSWAGFIQYTDAAGEPSARRIICRSISGYGRPETVTAFCYERRAHRTFRIDRIQELVCLETGEVLDPGQHFNQLWLHGALKVSDKTLTDIGRILVFMARCDGQFHPLESDSIATAMERYIVRFGGDDRTFETACKNINKIAPDSFDFVKALERMRDHPEARSLSRLLLDCVANVTAADGVIDAKEVEWASVVSETLKVMATA
ncbi:MULTISPECIES: TerB family tellurite resistance protein [unclassified Novosphingobium]|uniref:tellurite resistance TerB family protein n=1 Tax=unclassified Novosphingobium TaxID=2644732 RepID=UPI000D321F80|nr:MULTISPECIES: TerB family tellurite resistance protein [unclassified Novosphingobium]PTR08903.1 tellurite resistance protein TerB [Novosphingobium sp. GV055]PUB01815.1 tellurite resistance protein TerB [Novosphingobium sp. GV061]PUB17787.1 tellurite resistance protein TerB [Novosphingobium sp. GV079]PUB40481.1 tellurite resistance protein TerB [Novosphingobium sp. GV027]